MAPLNHKIDKSSSVLPRESILILTHTRARAHTDRHKGGRVHITRQSIKLEGGGTRALKKGAKRDKKRKGFRRPGRDINMAEVSLLNNDNAEGVGRKSGRERS